MKANLDILYRFVPFIVLKYYDTSQLIVSEFTPILTGTICFYMMFIYLNNCEPKLKQRPTDIANSMYVNSISLYTGLISLLIDNVSALLLLRYISWIFTFPFLLVLDNKNLQKRPGYNINVSIGIAIASFVSHTIHHITNRIQAMVICYILSIYFTLYYNWSDTIYKIPLHSYINIIWVAYGVTNIVYVSGYIDKERLYVCYTVMDLLSKSFFTYNYQISNVKNITNRYGILKVARMFYPMIQRAVSSKMISDYDFAEITNHLDLWKDDIESFKTRLVDELFPNNSWKNMISLQKQHTLYPRLGVLFCDIVGYSTFVMSNPIEESIRFVDSFYTKIDMIVTKHGVQKVETIGDAYLIVSEDVEKLLACAVQISQSFCDMVRIGVHVGEAASCTLGISKLRHAYVGHAINVAARLETSGEQGRIHVSEDVKEYCEEIAPGLIFTSRGDITLKGVGSFKTYFMEYPLNERYHKRLSI